MGYWQAFIELCGFRRFESGQPERFSLADIRDYCELVGMKDAAARVVLVRVVKALDLEWFALRRPAGSAGALSD